MTAWPTQTAIIAATHGNTARDAERRASMAALDDALHASLCLLILSARGHRLPIDAILTRINAGRVAAHRAIGA